MKADRPNSELFSLLEPARLTAVVDIGANPIDGDPPYKGMLAKGLCTLVGFEPLKAVHSALDARKGPKETYLPYAVGDGQTHVLNVCRARGMTSLLKPDRNVLKHFREFSSWGEVVRQERLTTARLDDIKEVQDLDYLKIDVQGSELSVFRGGHARLSTAVVVQTEVSFICMYEEQPPFGAIDLELRGLGFVPHAFTEIRRRLILPFTNSSNPLAAMNQPIEADVVYVRDFTRANRMSDEQLKHLALVAHHVYASFDLAANCIHHLKNRKAVAADAMERYVSIVGKAR